MTSLFDRGAAIVTAYTHTLSALPGVYAMKDEQGRFLYIGKAKSLPQRLMSYTQQSRLSGRLQRMISHVHSLETWVTHNENDALILEASMIYTHKPPYNILLKEGESFFFASVSDHPFPRLFHTRPHSLNRHHRWFGPYLSFKDVQRTLNFLYKITHIRSCTDYTFKTVKRPCLEYHIGRCSAPCVGRISKEDYDHDVRMAYDILQGKTQSMMDTVREDMMKASTKQDYQKAYTFQQRLKALERMHQRHDVYYPSFEYVDLMVATVTGERKIFMLTLFRGGFHRGSYRYESVLSWKEALIDIFEVIYRNASVPKRIIVSKNIYEHSHELSAEDSPAFAAIRQAHNKDEQRILDTQIHTLLHQKRSSFYDLCHILHTFGLPKRSYGRIEVYDNSHLQTTHAVGAMVVYSNAQAYKKDWKTFVMPRSRRSDTAMMETMIKERLRFLSADNNPDLIIIDGGKAQFMVAYRLLQTYYHSSPLKPCALISLAKGPRRGKDGETLWCGPQQSYHVRVTHPILQVLAPLRNAAHNYALKHHQKMRTRAMTWSFLDDVSGLGHEKKERIQTYLTRHKYDTNSSITEETWKNITGIGPVLARRLHQAWRSFFKKTSSHKVKT